MTNIKKEVCYDDFGAIGDGITDDLPAICKAHAYANERDLPVVARPDASYHLGSKAITAIISTNTDWNTARFVIDDTDVEDREQSMFKVCSLLSEVELSIDRLSRDQKTLENQLTQSCFVQVENDEIHHYIRRGLNQNNGVPQHDCFILHPNGSIEGDIDWDYDRISSVTAKLIEENTLTIKGGVFTTIANRMRRDVGYFYWARNIEIERSNTLIDGVTHYVVGETEFGQPYRGFLSAEKCANITFRNCFVTGHKMYSTIGSAGEPVNMGSYDLHANNIVNFTMSHCRMNHILDTTRWGIIGSNFCKNILVEEG